MSVSRHIVVIGAGITGLTTAHHLTAAACRVTVLEASDRLGGLLHTRHLHGYTVDVGAEAMHVGSPAVSSLLAEVGLAESVATARRGTSWLWTSRGRRPLPAGVTPAGPTKLLPVLKSRVMSPLGLLRAGLEPVLPRPALPAHHDVSVGDFVAGRFGREVAERLVDPLLGSLHAGDIKQLGLRSCAPSLVPAAESGRSLLRRRRPTAASPASPAPSPAVKRGPALMSFISWAAGLATVPEAIAQGLDVRLNSAAASLVRQGEGWTVHCVDGTWVEADAVVLAVPLAVARRLLAEHVDDSIFAGHSTASVATLVAAFPRTTLAAHGLGETNGLLIPSRHGSTLKAATFLSNKWDHFADAEHALVRMSVGRAGSEDVVTRADEAVADRALADLATFTGLRTTPEWVHVERWPHAMPQLTVGHTARLAALREALPAGLVVAGASYDGLGITSCLVSAAQAATQLAGR
ncbi:queuine tRNA-ribosyltransferase [Platysternon megacephalum]|uniref:Protoporphyrinogen oxidase n=1 Tax=Platysternon megacephalum TaxID=55544 RepID=A0A4D9DD05_9SAUR|nr:queuine tRNA-ribosyltransferase [Platysternon megacephalum]